MRLSCPSWLLVFLALNLAGCKTSPLNNDINLTRLSPAFYSTKGIAFSSQDYQIINFSDSKLDFLIRQAQQSNLDILQAAARIKQAKFLELQSLSTHLPIVDLQTDFSKDWFDGREQKTENNIRGSLSWELDLFNRLGFEQEARRFETKAREEDLRAIYVSLNSEIAHSYYSAIASHKHIALLRQQINSDQQLLGLIRQRLDAGVGTNIEVLQQQSQLAENESLIPIEEAHLRIAENRLDILLAKAPDALDRTDSNDQFPQLTDIPPTGVPSDLLLNRPDLLALKNRLIAADAEIGRAIADRLPHISLYGSYSIVNGTSIPSPVINILSDLVQPLLDWGRRKAEVNRNKALYEEKLAFFIKSYLIAIEEVENTLYQENRQREYIKRLEARRDILSRTVQSAETIYRQGESDYLPVLAAVEDLRIVERSIVSEEYNLILLRIQLYKALGKNIPSENPQNEETL